MKEQEKFEDCKVFKSILKDGYLDGINFESLGDANVKIDFIELGNRKFNLETNLYNFNKSNTLFFCEYCLSRYDIECSYFRHVDKCNKSILGGNVVYKENTIVVYKVEGQNNVDLCRNLCILGRGFIKNKTLYRDIENYNFYMLFDDSVFVGFFSDEHYNDANNLSCILVLPDIQKKGYGSLLVDLSYHFKKGTCEKPLSNEGQKLYYKYWKYKVYNYLKYRETFTIKEISLSLNMSINDVIVSLELLNIDLNKDKHIDCLKCDYKVRTINIKYLKK